MATKLAEGASDKKDKETLIAVLQFLKKKNLTETEKIFKQEANCLDVIKEFSFETTPDGETADLSSVLSAYNSDADPSRYEDFYASLQGFVEKSLDIYKPELAMVLYPLFIHMYLELVCKGHEKEAQSFFGKYRDCQEDYHDEDLTKLVAITRKEHMTSNDFMSTLRSNKFVIKMSRDTYHTLKKHLQDHQQEVLLTLIQQHLHFDVFEGHPRTKQAIESTTGAITGEATFEANKSKVHYGTLAEPDLGVVIEEETEEDDDKDKPKKKKAKKDSNGPGKKKQEHNPNAPPRNRIPFPEMKDSEKLMKVTMMREASKRLKLDSETLPSVCLYSVLNSHQSLNTVSISEDSSLLSAGFDNSTVRVWSLTPQKLRSLKSSSELLKIDKESEDVMERVMDDRSSTDCRRLIGHSGPVFSTSFSQDNQFLLSGSEDKTVRLWSLFTFSTLVSFKGHNYPVWDVTFCPRGYYFASASHDRTARLWSTDHHQPLRIFAGHMSDVNRVAFHPNCNYIATGSCDRTVRLWDIKTGSCTRLFTGHKGSVYSLVFSMDGRYLVSSGADARILFWDLAEGTLAADVPGHSGTVHSLVFSRDGNILASGGTDNCLKLWDAQAIYNSGEDMQRAGQPKGQQFGLGSYPTKNTPLHCLHFTLRNLLLASGPFSPA